MTTGVPNPNAAGAGVPGFGAPPTGAVMPAGTVIGQILYWDGISWVLLNPGAAGQQLVTNGAGAAPAWQDAQLPVNYIDGLDIAWLTVGTVSIGAGVARDGADAFNMGCPGGVVVDIAVAGPVVNGRDSAAALVTGWYYLYLINDSAGVNPPAGVFSASAAAPAFPAGYDTARRVASLYNVTPAVASLRRARFARSSRTLVVDWLDTEANLRVLTGGVSIVWSIAVAYSAFVPPTASLASLGMRLQGVVGVASNASIQPDTFASAGFPLTWTISVGAGVGQFTTKRERLPNTGALLYNTGANGATMDVWCEGFTETC